MNIYMSLYIWSILTWGASQFVSKEMRKLFFVILVFPFLFFVLGGRGPGVGTDTYMYNDLFYTLQGLFDGSSADTSAEFSYVLIANVLGTFNFHSQSIIFVYAFFTILATGWLFYNKSYNLFISTIIFIALFYFENFNTMRQSLSVVLSYVALFQYMHNKKAVGIIINVLATSIHSSAALFFPLLFLYPLTKKKIIIVVAMISLVGYLISVYGFSVAFYYLDESKYASYLLSTQFGEAKELGAGVIKVIAFLVTVILSFFIVRHKDFNNDKQDLYYMELLLILSCIATVMQYNISIFYRLIYPFAFSFCFLIPLLCKYVSFNKYFFYLPILLFLAYYLNRVLINTPVLQYYFYTN